jgi:hypothetical protein
MIPPYFCDYLPFEKDLALFSTIEFPLSKDKLYQVFEICWLVLGKNFFLISVLISFDIIYPFWRGIHLDPLLSRMFVTSLVKIDPVVLEKK